MNTRFAILALVSLLCTSGYADIIYDFDFEEPDFTVDTQITSGSGYIADGDVFVRTGVADFSTQVASLEPAGSLSFGVAPSLTSGVVSISWEMALLVFGSPSGGNTARFAIGSNSEGSTYFAASYNGDGTLHDMNGSSLGVNYALGSLNTFQVFFDLDGDTIDFIVDGQPILEDVALSPTGSPEWFVVSRGFQTSPEYAIDNFRWEVIPEPTSLPLTLLGAFTLYFARRHRQTRRE